MDAFESVARETKWYLNKLEKSNDFLLNCSGSDAECLSSELAVHSTHMRVWLSTMVIFVSLAISS